MWQGLFGMRRNGVAKGFLQVETYTPSIDSEAIAALDDLESQLLSGGSEA